MKIKVLHLSFVGFLAVMALVVVAACAPKAVTLPAAKPTEVWLRGSAAMTGIYSGSLLPASQAFKEAVELVNKEGGIDGVTWKLELLDDGGDVARAIANYEQLKARQRKGLMMLLISTSGVAEALRERFNEDNIICMLPAGSATALYPAGNSFCIVISHADGFGFFCDWLAETQPKPIKLGFCNWDTTFGRSVLTEECLNYAKSKGIEIVATELFPITQMDVSTQLTRIKDKGANWVFTNTLGFGTLVVLKSASAVGLIGKMNFAGGHFAVDYDVRRTAGPLGEGFVGPHSAVTWDETDNPYVVERRQAFEAAKRPEEERAQPYLLFKGVARYIADIFEAAIDDVGWDKLDVAALKKQIVKTKNRDLGWTILTFTADKPETRHVRMVQFKNGKVLPITGWRMAPDLRPAQYKK